MKRIINRILFNAITFEILSIIIYIFYCVIFAISSIPSFLLIKNMVWLLQGNWAKKFAFVLICFISLYVFWICSALLVGLVERLLTLGFKEGKYATSSFTFLRWLIVSGLHLWALYLVLPYLQGSNWIKLYLRIVGAKVGKNVFINTRLINDAYLLTIEDNVVIGGDAVITCHLFENNMLILGKIVLCEGASIGANSYITPGAVINENSKIGIFTKLRRNSIVAKGSTVMALPGMNIRQVARIMRSAHIANSHNHKENSQVILKKTKNTVEKSTDEALLENDKTLMLEEYKIICSYITSRDALRWTILGAAIGAYGLIISKIFEKPEWTFHTLAMLLFGCFVLTVATIQNTRLYEYCKVARRRAVFIEKKLNMLLYSEYKNMKLIGMKTHEIPKVTGWFTALLPIFITILIIGYLWWVLGMPPIRSGVMP